MRQVLRKFTQKTDTEIVSCLPATVFAVRLETQVTRVDDVIFGNIILQGKIRVVQVVLHEKW